MLSSSAADRMAVASSGATKPLLRVMTCGSVDDGKSTMLGRLLFDARMLLDDQIATLDAESRRVGNDADATDFSLLFDGLEAEREQGITIDVAYRFVTTKRRRLILADAPGHEQYTRNMATAASNADVALLLVDARKGILTQTRRHAFIASLMGVRHLLLAVNKMDLVGFDEGLFRHIVEEFEASVAAGPFASMTAVPISAKLGDNITTASRAMPWFDGPTILGELDGLDVDGHRDDSAPFRMQVQWVNRPSPDFRGYCGTIASGQVSPGDEIVVVPGAAKARVERVVTFDGDRKQAAAGDAVTVLLDREVDISRGDVIAAAAAPVEEASQFAATLIWFAERAMIPGRAYLCKTGTRTLEATVTNLRHRIDVNTREQLAADKLDLNDIGRVTLALGGPVAFAPYTENRELGGFILIDRQTSETLGVGMIDHSLARSTNVAWQELIVGRAERAAIKHQSPCVLWFTGLSGSGKSTIANIVERQLHALGRHTYMLDGDNLRHGLNRDLGFKEGDRVENIRRMGEVAALFVDAGMIVLVSAISPYRADRDQARSRVADGEFLEVFVDTPIEECKRRDPKGLYDKAVRGLIPNFTGISAPYEAPLSPELHLDTIAHTPEQLASRIVEILRRRRIVT